MSFIFLIDNTVKAVLQNKLINKINLTNLNIFENLLATGEKLKRRD